MKTSASRWSKEWLPSVTASAPAASRSSQIASVMPKPPAAFSPLMTTQSSFQRRAQAGQLLRHRVAAGAADDVTEEEKTHGRSSALVRL